MMLKFLALICTFAAGGWPATQLVMLGSGTPQADPERSGPAVAIVHEGKAYLFDSGPGVVRRAAAAAARLKIAGLQAPRLNIVFLTHLHSDHTLGLPDLIFSPWVLGRQESLRVYGPKGTRAMTDHLIQAWKEDIRIRTTGLERGNTMGYKVVVTEIQPGIVFAQDNIEIAALPVHHGSVLQAFGYKISTPDKVIVISGDCAPPSPAILQACNRCDLLVHEVYSTRFLEQRSLQAVSYARQFHTSATEVAAIASKSKPRTLVLYHLLTGPTTDDELVAEVQSAYEGKVVVARDLEVYQ